MESCACTAGEEIQGAEAAAGRSEGDIIELDIEGLKKRGTEKTEVRKLLTVAASMDGLETSSERSQN